MGDPLTIEQQDQVVAIFTDPRTQQLYPSIPMAALTDAIVAALPAPKPKEEPPVEPPPTEPTP